MNIENGSNNPPPSTPIEISPDELLSKIETILLQAEEQKKPLEVDPQRADLFQLFVCAEQAGCLKEGAPVDLTADTLCARIAERWKLRDSAQKSVADQAQLPPEQLSKMRLLWSLLRMWMEWDYAWGRWSEFHHAK